MKLPSLLLALASPTFVPFASATEVTVTADSGVGSLRSAIMLTPAGGTVTFAQQLAGETISLTSDSLVIHKKLTIDASALSGGIVISGNSLLRVFRIGAEGSVVMKSLRIFNGRADVGNPNDAGLDAGGGILNQGALTLNQCTFFNNRAGLGGAAIYSTGKLTLNDCTVTGNSARYFGGGILSGSELTVNRSTFDNNTAGYDAGAIYNDGGTFTLNQSTLTENSAGYDGGAVYNSSGTMTVSSSTLSGNTAAHEGGGIVTLNRMNLRNSILVGNTAPAATNLKGASRGSKNLTSGNPKLGPLGNYGGLTRTMPPQAGSPAINAAGTTQFTTDQRGLPRLVGGAADIGAVETGPVITVTTVVDENDGPSLGGVSLRDAIGAASSGSTITFAPALSGQTILLLNQLVVAKNLVIDASPLPGGITVTGENLGFPQPYFPAWRIEALGSLVMDSVSVVRTAQGIQNFGNLTLNQCSISFNGVFRGTGGGISNSGSLELNRCTLEGNNTGNGSAGAIYNNGAALTLNQCTLANNSARSAAGIECVAGMLTVNQSTFSNNSSPFTAAAIAARGSTVGYVLQSIFSGNAGSKPQSTSFETAASVVESNNYIYSVFPLAPQLNIGSDPMLSPLGNYGGLTKTLPPLLGSPVIDAGDPVDFVTDQRGLPRVVGSAPDIGAVEFQ